LIRCPWSFEGTLGLLEDLTAPTKVVKGWVR
jgi:hypothetical protein